MQQVTVVLLPCIYETRTHQLLVWIFREWDFHTKAIGAMELAASMSGS